MPLNVSQKFRYEKMRVYFIGRKCTVNFFILNYCLNNLLLWCHSHFKSAGKIWLYYTYSIMFAFHNGNLTWTQASFLSSIHGNGIKTDSILDSFQKHRNVCNIVCTSFRPVFYFIISRRKSSCFTLIFQLFSS